MKYYSLKNILQKDCIYNMIIGERSNGKTYSVLEYGIKKCFNEKTGERTSHDMAIIRRMEDDFKQNRASQVFASLINNGLVEKYSKGKFNTIDYYSRKWYFAYYDTDKGKLIRDAKPFCYAFAISTMEHDKSTSYPNVETILFDEFLTRHYYLAQEFVLFTNVLSTIIRERDNVKIFMLGNTVNKYCPYFEEMGLKHIDKMKSGDIDVYRYGDSGLSIAVEYASATTKGKKSDKYFAFDNPKLKMITEGEWEIDIYPHLPTRYTPKDILFNYFIVFGKETLHCEIIEIDGSLFTYIHRKTTPIKDEDTDIVFSLTENTHKSNWRKNITKVYDRIGKKIYDFFLKDKVFYQTNEVGEIVMNYLKECGKH